MVELRESNGNSTQGVNEGSKGGQAGFWLFLFFIAWLIQNEYIVEERKKQDKKFMDLNAMQQIQINQLRSRLDVIEIKNDN